MYLKQSIRKKSGRIYLVIAQKYRNSKTGQSTDRTVKSIGYLDELEEKYDDPIAHFREVARQMTEEEDKEKHLFFDIDMDERLPDQAEGAKNLGYAIPLRVYHTLGLHTFLKASAHKNAINFNLNMIMILLVTVRLLAPGTQKRAYDERKRFFEHFDFSLEDVYCALTFFDKIAIDLQRFMHVKIAQEYGRDTSVIYYTKANYFFERNPDDSIRYNDTPLKSRSKPVVQIGFALDRDGVPINYVLSHGNLPDKETFQTVISETVKYYTYERTVVVANMGALTDDSIRYLVWDRSANFRNGYIFDLPIQKWSCELKDYVLEETGYRDENGMPATSDSIFKIKSRRRERDIITPMHSKNKPKFERVKEKQVVYWSHELFCKNRTDRASVIVTAEDIIENPEKYNKTTAGMAAQYITHLRFDDETGKIISMNSNAALALDQERIREEEKYDGYYLIVTSEIELLDDEVVDIYRSLHKIEDACEIIKNDFVARRVYARNSCDINAHFLVYFIALSILQLIQKKTGKRYMASDVIDCLNRLECMHEENNIFLLAFKNEISEVLSAAFNIDFSKKRLTLAEINKILSDAKKGMQGFAFCLN